LFNCPTFPELIQVKMVPVDRSRINASGFLTGHIVFLLPS